MMNGFVVFIIVLVVIWTLSGIATWVNKQKEQERRRMLRQQLGQPPRAGARPLPTSMRSPPRAGTGRPPARTINRGIAERFPDVLLPPAPQQPMRKAMPPRQPLRQAPVRLPSQPRPLAKRPKQQQRPVAQQQAIPVLMEAEPSRPQIATPTPPPPRQQHASSRINAGTISRWLRPQTLNQQFVLTEIFQPPIAMRDRHLI